MEVCGAKYLSEYLARDISLFPARGKCFHSEIGDSHGVLFVHSRYSCFAVLFSPFAFKPSIMAFVDARLTNLSPQSVSLLLYFWEASLLLLAFCWRRDWELVYFLERETVHHLLSVTPREKSNRFFINPSLFALFDRRNFPKRLGVREIGAARPGHQPASRSAIDAKPEVNKLLRS